MATVQFCSRFCNHGLDMRKKTHPWYRTRKYLHFDSPVKMATAQGLVMSPYKVARHAFYPLINYEIRSFKIKRAGDKIEKVFKSRPIAYAAHMDSHIYAYYSWILSKCYEEAVRDTGIANNVLAFRSLGKSNIQFANDAFDEISRRKVCSAVALDVSGFFDNLDHQVLKQNWCRMLDVVRLPDDHFNVFSSITKFSQVDRNNLYETLGISKNNPKNGRFRVCTAAEFRQTVRKAELIKTNSSDKGIPQGSPISALLSNIYMLEFDIRAKQVVEEVGGIYFRYCDDMLFIVPPEHKNDIEAFAIKEIKDLKLTINTKKTEVRDFWMDNGLQVSNRPLQYLGFTFDGQRKLLRSAALARFSGRMKKGVKLAKRTVDRINDERLLNHQDPERLRKKKLYERYSHLGRRNFITYAHRAAKQMQAPSIKKQIKPLWRRLQSEIAD